MPNLVADPQEVRRLIALADEIAPPEIAPPGEELPVDERWDQELTRANIATLYSCHWGAKFRAWETGKKKRCGKPSWLS